MSQATRQPQTQREVPLSPTRKMIARRMTVSHTTIPSVTIAEDCDVTDLDLRLLVGHVAASIGRAVVDYPVFNAHFADGHLTFFDRCDVGVAIDTDEGLLVPVLRDCTTRLPGDLQDEVRVLASRARSRDLTLNEMQGATISFTSPGRRGGLLATPLISPPQTCIVGMHRATPRPHVVDGQIRVRTISSLTVTFDHRVIDGATAGDFTLALARHIQAPTEALAGARP